jgi:hypothetical protein
MTSQEKSANNQSTKQKLNDFSATESEEESPSKSSPSKDVSPIKTE